MELPPEQSRDWSYARNKRVVLMTPSAEWVQSVFSSTWQDSNGNRLIAPNRDYPYEGLLAYHLGEHWKYIDCMAIGLRDREGRQYVVDRDAERRVQATPWRTTYAYVGRAEGDDAALPLSLVTTYYLSSNSSPTLTTAAFDVYCPISPANTGMTLIIEPLLDIRHMYGGSNHDECRVTQDEQRLHVSFGGRRLTFYHSALHAQVFASPSRKEWTYKLGTGAREERENDTRQMGTGFVPETRQVASLFRLEVPLSPNRGLTSLVISCGPEFSDPFESFEAARAHVGRSRRGDREERRRIYTTFPLRKDIDGSLKEALAGRIVGLKKFKTFVRMPGGDEYVKVPHAGSWWFRTPWYRDVFEGIATSFETLMRLPEERDNVRLTTLHALASQHPDTGLIQARLPEFATQEPSYNSADATLLCLLVAGRYVARTGDVDFARMVLPQALEAIAAFRANHDQGTPRNGPPRLHPATGLLLCVPHHSWIDTQCLSVEYAGCRLEDLPNRVSARFVRDVYDTIGDKDAIESLLLSARFLPEINAQWIAALEGVLAMIRGAAFEDASPYGPRSAPEIAALLDQARANYKQVFWNEDKQFLFNLVDEHRQFRDQIECEAAVTSAAMLNRTIFTDEELGAIWQRTKRYLVVTRKLQRYGTDVRPFGIMTRYEDQRIYYNDRQYHSDVIWPRSTAYLVRLLNLLGLYETAEDLLLNTLDHQMTEAAIYYNQEVFSRPCGNNPAPEGATAGNPVPVKNPIQFWSQWCDPFLDAYEEKVAQDG